MHFFSCSLLTLSLVTSSIFGHPLYNTEEFEQNINELLIDVEENSRFYIQKEQLSIQEKGIFIEIDSGHFLQIPFLSSDEKGFYTLLPLKSTDSTVYAIIKCKNCHKYFSADFFNKGKCPSCGAQN